MKKIRYLKIVSLFGVIGIVFYFLHVFGIAERINVYSIVIYGGILSLWMYKNIKHNGVQANCI